MTNQMWYVFGSSVQGASHIRAKLPNQDAIDWLACYGREQQFVTLAIADGHGNARYFRSEIGSQKAVYVAKTILRELGRAYCNSRNLAPLKEMAEQHLPQILVRQWEDEIAAHLAAAPFTQAELTKQSADFRAKLAVNPRLAYGSTVAAALITQTFILYLQLGDGDIFTIDKDGDVARAPLAIDPHLSGDATTSLCMNQSWRYVRTYLQPITEQAPAMLMLATDGYANSFATEAGFLEAGRDFFNIVNEQARQGLHTLRDELPHWLSTTSERGSGDDISVGFLYRPV